MRRGVVDLVNGFRGEGGFHAKTGLSIIEGSVTMYRVSVARPGRSPMNPKERPADPVGDRRDWSRFDTPGLTIYGVGRRVTAFTESLAFKAPSARNYAATTPPGSPSPGSERTNGPRDGATGPREPATPFVSRTGPSWRRAVQSTGIGGKVKFPRRRGRFTGS